MENKLKLIMLIVVFSIFNLFWIVVLLYFNIFYPAYLSVQNGCNVISNEELNNLGYRNLGYYKMSDNSITYLNQYNEIVDESQVDEKIIRHENCHKWQNENNILHSCDYKFFRYMDEVTCYIYQYL